MSRLVSELWLQRCLLSSHAFSVITFLTPCMLFIPADLVKWFVVTLMRLKNYAACLSL
jgi:hypothetical protein